MKHVTTQSSLLFIFLTFFLSPAYAQDSAIVLSPASTQEKSVHEQALPSDYEKADALLREAREFLKMGQMDEVERRLTEALVLGGRLDTVSEIRRVVGEINSAMLFSKKPAGSSEIYTVKPGDNLAKIAKKYNTNVGLVMRSNRLQNSIIRVGEKLKVSKAAYSIIIDKSDHTLTLLSDRKFFKQYPIAVGKSESETPAGSFSIESRLENPTWFHKGKAIPSGDPENILGTRWMGFSIPSYGIHGTTQPESIGTDSTSGCIRMHNQDVEELYDIVPLHSWVTVTD